ncbi:putative LRR receptor-like serine/threonine-protein kinase-like [Dorcoceras hygrometricum]|uniref:Putative LRR receptor-like serine/threonine-protein kinase-like n=1 Tax=Dorcoceras hygrometricum TaxID=472368 RepID=A0A2Z7C755_9LAMI|nr:putative LRR receptor-like serine/threonine-protein kinase-like [Dorcoceras hygrometricum]
MHTQPLASRDADQNGCSDPKASARPELRLTQEALETLMEETIARTMTAAVNHFVASRQHRTTSSSGSFTRDNSVKQAEEDESSPTEGVIAVVTGGPECGDSNNARKAFIWAARGGN